jgi:hypothetical protein
VTLGLRGGALARLRTRRSRSGRLAALSIRIPFPVGRAGRDGGWRRMLGNAAALLSKPIPVGRAVVSTRREWRRRVSVRKAAGAAAPPPFVGPAVVVAWWRSRRWATRVCTGPKVRFE